jgi:hypothetical protein
VKRQFLVEFAIDRAAAEDGAQAKLQVAESHDVRPAS